MELHQLRCAVAVADHGSFTRAAAALYTTQPTLSYTVAKLETDLGVTLFLRQPRKVVLTAAGEEVLKSARRMLALADEVQASARAVGGAMVGGLRIAAHSNAIAWLTDQLRRFHVTHPQVVLTILNVDDGREAVEFVRDGRAELSIVSLGGVQSDLTTVDVLQNELVCVLPEGTAPSTDAVSLEYLSSRGLIAPAPGSAIRDIFDGQFLAAGVVPNVVAQCQDLQWIIEMVRAGIGCALTDLGRLSRVSKEGIVVRPTAPRISFSLTLIYAPDRCSTAARVFVALTREDAG